MPLVLLDRVEALPLLKAASNSALGFKSRVWGLGVQVPVSGFGLGCIWLIRFFTGCKGFPDLHDRPSGN